MLNDLQVEGIPDCADEDDEWGSSAYTTEDIVTAKPNQDKSDGFSAMIRSEPTPAQLAALENMKESVSMMGTAGLVHPSTPDAVNPK